MSNVGKSFWRERLATYGFFPFWCDYEIEIKLDAHLKGAGYRGIKDVAKWMGQPYEERSRAHQAIYLEQEIQVMQEALSLLRGEKQGLIIDTTGSVIYTGDALMEELRKLSTIVLLDAPESLQDELYRAYIAEPKPVVWGEVYSPLPGETAEAALARCYPLLLQSRNWMYKRYADIILDYHELRSQDFTTEDFLRKIGAI
ncbi:MAG: hypothetical protein WAP23_02840 [Candidatus Spechtbacterales bacterium]